MNHGGNFINIIISHWLGNPVIKVLSDTILTFHYYYVISVSKGDTL